jgi:hypothetical protein
MGALVEARALLRNPADPHAWDAFVDRYTPLVAAWCRRAGWGSGDPHIQGLLEEHVDRNGSSQ